MKKLAKWMGWNNGWGWKNKQGINMEMGGDLTPAGAVAVWNKYPEIRPEVCRMTTDPGGLYEDNFRFAVQDAALDFLSAREEALESL